MDQLIWDFIVNNENLSEKEYDIKFNELVLKNIEVIK